MNGKRTLIVTIALLVMLVSSGWAATLEVSQPVQVTSDSYYERGQAIVYDGSDYWLFYGRSASCTDPYSSGNPDIHDYAIHYKKASSVPGLASATAVGVPGATGCYLGETGAAVVDGKVWTFGTVPSVTYVGQKSLYGWYTTDGTSWTQVADLWDDMSPGSAHHDEAGFDGKLYIMANHPETYGGWYTKYTDDPTAGTITWSTPIALNTTTNHVNGTGHFYVEGTDLYIGLMRTSPDQTNFVLQYTASPEAWSSLCSASSTAYDPTLFKVGTEYVYAQAPWVSPSQYIIAWSGSSLSTVLGGSAVSVTEGGYGSNGWVDMWPTGFTDNGGTSYLFYTSERDDPAAEGVGNIWYLEVDWTVSNDHYTYLNEAVGSAADADEISVADGTYTEAVSISGKGVTITGESEAGTIVEAAASPLSSSNVFTIAASGYDVTLEYMTIRNGRYGIRSSAGDVDVLHCTFYHNGYDGTPYPYPPTAANCATHWATYANDGGAMRLQSSGESEIAYCTVYDNDRGIRYQDGANGDIHDNVAHDNIQSGIYLAATTYSGATGCSDTEVYDNVSYNNKEHGLLSIGGIGNTFEDNDLYDNWNAGVMMWHVADNMIAGNAISGNNLYSFNGWGAASDSKGAVCAIGTDWNTGGSYVFKLLGNDIANNFAGNAPTATGVKIGTSGTALPAAATEVKYNVFTGHDIDVHVYSQAALADVHYNSFTGTSYGVKNEDTAKAVLDAEMNWWGAADGPSGAYSGSGVPVSTEVDYDPWIGKDPGGENVVCVPDPLDLVVGSTTGSIDVNYLGGGGGLLYGYSVTVTWDDSVADLTVITQGALLSDAGGTTFFTYGSGGTRTIDCALTGGAAGVTGPGTLFTLAFTEDNSGTSTVVLSPVVFRDNGNNPLSGFYVDDGLINVDVTDPVFTDVSLFNLTLGHTDDYAKNTDDLELTADVTDDYSLVREDIVADLSGLISGGATAEVAEFYSSGVATWTTALAGVTLTADGAQTVTVTATDWLGNSASDSDAITVDNTAPGTVSGLDAAPAHEEVVLLWDDASGAPIDYYGVMVRYNVWGDYPTYDLSTPVYPTDETEGVLAFSGDATGTTYAIVPRDIHYFSAFVYDWALNYGTVTTAGQDRATNYWLGDVANVGNNWTPDGSVTVADIVKLSTLYGSAPSGDELKCDVGPTDDNSRVGIPEPDDMLSFEDLMIFAMNYGIVGAKVVPFLGDPGGGDLALALIENGRSDGGVLELALRLEGNAGDVKGLTAELEFEGLEFLSARLSDEMSSPVADMFFWSDATSRSVQVDAAVLGTDVTIGGSGDVVLFSFQVLDETYAVDFTSAELRGASNEDLTAELEGLSSEGVPVAFKLVQNSPNPFNPVTTVAYHVPHESRVTIRVFDVTGRLVTTLVDGVVEPGRHSAVWNGTNGNGESVGSGVYFCTMETPDYRDSHKMTLLK